MPPLNHPNVRESPNQGVSGGDGCAANLGNPIQPIMTDHTCVVWAGPVYLVSENMLVWAAVPVPRSTLIGDLNWPPPNKVGADHQYNHVFKHRVLKSL